MKSKSKISVLKILFFLGVACGMNTPGQGQPQNCTTPPNCLVNPEITAPNGGELNITSTVNGWFRSHGTPNVQMGTGPAGSNALWMWSYGGSGEGVYACYNFQQGRTYQICLWVQNHAANSMQTGNLRIMAANGLVQGNQNTITVPNPGSSQLISNAWNFNANWTQVVLNYTPNANYSQFWLYPFLQGPSVNGLQYSLRVARTHIMEIPAVQSSFSLPCGGSLSVPAANGCLTTQWFAPNGSLINTRDLVIDNIQQNQSGVYTMVITSGDCSITIPIEVIVESCNCEDAAANFTAQTSGTPVLFTETSTGPGTTVAWFWDFGDGGTSNQQNPSHAYSQPGSYQVCLTIIRRVNGQTCCRQICKNVNVGVPPGGRIAPVDEPKGKVTLKPNPTGDVAFVTVENMSNPKVTLYTMQGAKAGEGTRLESGVYAVKMQHLAPGVYLVEVKSDSGTQTLKVVKE